MEWISSLLDHDHPMTFNLISTVRLSNGSAEILLKGTPNPSMITTPDPGLQHPLPIRSNDRGQRDKGPFGTQKPWLAALGTHDKQP